MQELVSSLPDPWSQVINAALMGDAFGVPHEFKIGSSIPLKQNLAMIMSPNYSKTFTDIPYGTWSDDGSQMLALLDVLVKCQGKYSANQFGFNLLSWLNEAHFQAGSVVFDCGMQTRRALDAYGAGRILEVDESHCGNGSLMRVLPVAALPDAFGVSQRDALQIAMLQSDITHPQKLCRVCCAIFVQLVWLVKDGGQGVRALLPLAVRIVAEHGILSSEEYLLLETILQYGAENMPTNSGYVLNSFWSAMWSIDRSESLSDTLRNVVSVGGDTDTVACIAAGLASLRFGWDDLSHEWCWQMWRAANF